MTEEPRADKEHLDEILDEALENTFPASDPIELTPEPDERKQPPADPDADDDRQRGAK